MNDWQKVRVMNATMMRTEAVNERWPVETLVICDHYESECRARAFLDKVAATAGEGIRFNLTYWRLEGLSDPSENIGVFGNVWCPTVLMLALRTGGEVPKSLFQWVEYWAECRAGGYSALVGLGNLNTAAVEQLQQVAGRRGIALSCEQSNQAALGCQSFIAGLKGREQVLMPILQKTLDDSPSGYSHWGLNE